jgi:1-acyl-sn-glycerol-3-phosphate acyltransferase
MLAFVGKLLLATGGVALVLLKLRKLPPAVMQVWFSGVLICVVLLTGAVTFLIDLARLVGVPPASTQRWCAVACKYIFKLLLLLNPQVRVRMDESRQKWSKIPNGSAVICNHTSFLDAFVFTGYSPVSYISNARTLMKDSLKRLPIFGSVFDRVGHFPVYFKSEEGGAFGVDPVKQAPVNELVQKHLETGGRIALFPEGQVNKNPTTLMPFRNGTFSTIIKHKLPVYYVIMVGNDTVWPPASSAGTGTPTTIDITVGSIPINHEVESDPAALSTKCQAAVQKTLDEVNAKRMKGGL